MESILIVPKMCTHLSDTFLFCAFFHEIREKNYFHRKSVDVDDCLLGKEIEAPKVLDISEIDRKSTEWNVNFFNKDDNSIDSTLLGLFNLGDS